VRAHDPQSAENTIFALSTGTGPAGIAVVRVSGPNALEAFQLTKSGRIGSERRAELRQLIAVLTGDRIDDALVIWFPEKASYTGENVVEFQVHGGRAVVSTLTAALSGLPGFRPAEPGEFTRRAVENGRMDLTRAEAIADLIAADTDGQRRLALKQYDGGLEKLYRSWRERLIRAAAWIEANIDFPDEEMPDGIWEKSRGALRQLGKEIEQHLNDGRRGEIVREGFHVAVVGPPNAGKSSLVNALARRDVAIVSDIPGTTRDVIEVKLDLGGYAVVLADTAGLRDSFEPIEHEGIRRARERAASADFRLLVLDAAHNSAGASGVAADLVVRNKADLVRFRGAGPLFVSAKTGEGLDELVCILSTEASGQMAAGEGPMITRARHRHGLGETVARIGAALQEEAPELAAEQLRLGLRSLGRITGEVDLEELLDVVFRDFCIGK
jgi:tRNA modification GTPase